MQSQRGCDATRGQEKNSQRPLSLAMHPSPGGNPSRLDTAAQHRGPAQSPTGA